VAREEKVAVRMRRGQQQVQGNEAKQEMKKCKQHI